MPRATKRNAWAILGLSFVVLLTLVVIPPVFDLEPPLDSAEAVQSQREPSSCEAVGNNWTACDNANVSDNAYANATDGRGPAQFARPDFDISIVNWNDSAGDGVNYSKIDEVVADEDASYTQTNEDPDNGDDAEFRLSDVTDPQISTGHFLRYRFKNGGSNPGGPDVLNVTVELKQGAAIIASWPEIDVRSLNYATSTQPLTQQEANNITDYSSLSVNFDVSFEDNGGSQTRAFRLTWLGFQVPGIPFFGKNDTAWRNFGYALDPEDAVNRVEVGVEWHRISPEPILNVTVSWDGGLTWASNQTATNKSLDDDLTEWLDFSGAVLWTPAHLNNANLRVRVGTNASDAILDYVTTRVNFNAAPEISEFRLQTSVGLPMEGERLEVGVEYRLVFNVTDEDGWTDIAENGSVSVRLWYDGNQTSELTYDQQTNGTNYRIELKYQDTGDVGAATLDEWSIIEGRARYNASRSSLSEIMSGPTLVGYEFNLSFMLGFHTKAASDPTNNAPGDYNDLDSWNAEVVATDGVGSRVLQTVSTGEHMEFGVFPQALLEYNTTVSPETISPAINTVFTVVFDNTGEEMARSVWVNVTLPLGRLVYVTDTAVSIGGIRSAPNNFTFSNVTPGEYTFTITASALGLIPDGTVATTSFAYEAANLTGVPINQTSQDVDVTIQNAAISLVLFGGPSSVNPLDQVNLTAQVDNVGAAVAKDVTATAWLDSDVTYISSTPSGMYNPAAMTVTWSPEDIDPGGNLTFNWTFEIIKGISDESLVTSNISVAYEDLNGSAMPVEREWSNSTAEVPNFTVELQLSQLTAERGDAIMVTLRFDNSGSGTASYAWVNWTLDSSLELGGEPTDGEVSDTDEGFIITLSNKGPGPHSLSVTLRVLPGEMVDGLPMDFEVSWQATYGNGIRNSDDDEDVQGTVTLLAPEFSLELDDPPPNVRVGDRFTLNLTIHNSGNGEANDTLLSLPIPAGVEYRGDSGTFLPVESQEQLSWELGRFEGNSRLVLAIEFESTGESSVARFQFSLEFSDKAGSPSDVKRSDSVSVSFFSPSTFPLWILWVAIIAGAAAIVIFLFVGRPLLSSLSIEEVFVVHRSGILIAHSSRTLTPDQDEDILAAMLKTVQDFVQDAFSSHDDAPMRGLQFGKFNILIEQGTDHYVAVVYKGTKSPSLEVRLSRMSRRIDEEFGDVLKGWDGAMNDVKGIRHILPALWGGGKVRRKDKDEVGRQAEIKGGELE